MLKSKNVITAIIVLFTGTFSFAQTTFPLNPAGKVTYTKTFNISQSSKDEDVYSLVYDWLQQNPELLTRSNNGTTEIPAKKSGRKAEVETEFSNATPVQSLNPAEGRIVTRGLVKYNGGFNTCINMLYIQYYMLIEVKDHRLTATISDIQYHHFNRTTWGSQGIYNWAGGKPCDANNYIEHLAERETYHEELSRLCNFMAHDTDKLFAELRNVLVTGKLTASAIN